MSRSTCIIPLYPATDGRQTGDNFVADTRYMSTVKWIRQHVSWCKRSFKPRLHQDRSFRRPRVHIPSSRVLFTPTNSLAIGYIWRVTKYCMLLVAVNKIVASLLPVCCRIQRDTSRIVIMLPRYSQHVARTSNLLP